MKVEPTESIVVYSVLYSVYSTSLKQLKHISHQPCMYVVVYVASMDVLVHMYYSSYM